MIGFVSYYKYKEVILRESAILLWLFDMGVYLGSFDSKLGFSRFIAGLSAKNFVAVWID